jgi:hypothetical protein
MPATNPARYTDPLRATRTRQEAARVVGCGDAKITELVEAHLLDVVPVGNRQLITTASLEKLIGQPLAGLEAQGHAAEADRLTARAARHASAAKQLSARGRAKPPVRTDRARKPAPKVEAEEPAAV